MKPICRECKWSRRDWTGWKYARCYYPDNVQIVQDVVTGKRKTVLKLIFCETHREHRTGCGPEGDWWEARVGIVQRIMEMVK